MNLAGAVDLAALAAKKAPLSNAFVLNVTTASFEADVLERSVSVPVVVDLWSPRSAASKQLSPILEKVAGEYVGRFIVARVDVDTEPAVAQMFQVQSVPTVVAIVGGNPVPLFQGAATETQIRDVIEQLLAAAQKMGISGQVEAPEPAGDPRFEAAEAALETGDWAAATAAYQQILAVTPGDSIAKVGLLNVALFARTDGREVADELALVGDDLETQMRIADAEFLCGMFPEAFDRLIAHVRDKAAKDRLLEYFDIVGPEDPSGSAARRKMASALF